MSFLAIDLWYLCVPVAIFLLAYWYLGLARTARLDIILAGALLVLGSTPLFFTAAQYVASNVYLDHLEPSVGATAYVAFFSKQALYHGNDFSQLYQLPYGPGVFIANALPYLILPATIPVSKLAPLIALIIAAAFTIWGLWRSNGSIALAFLAGLLMLGQLGLYHQVTYWNRPEPFLILAISLGVFASTLTGRKAPILMGLALAFTISLKPHLGCAFLVLLWRLQRNGGMRALLICSLATAIPLLGIEALPAFSFSAYWAVLQDTAHHPFDFRLLSQNLSLAAALLFVPLARQIVGWIENRPRAAKDWLSLPVQELFVFAVSLAPVTAIALKAGAGHNHLLPYFPLAVLLLLSPPKSANPAKSESSELAASSEEKVTSSQLARGGIAGLACAAVISSLSGSATQLPMLATIKDMHAQQSVLTAQLQQIVAHYPGKKLEMGYGNLQSYGFASARPLLYFAGSPMELDGAALMDITMYANAPTDHMIGTLAQCRPQVWVMPRVDPAQYFTLQNFYELQGFQPKAQGMFSDGFKRAFFANYQPDFATEHYVAYRCRTMR